MVFVTAVSLVTFAAAMCLTVTVRTAASRWGIVDRPDGKRKLHGGPRALWGGVAVYGAMVLGLLVVRLGPAGADSKLVELSVAWMIAAGFVCFVGGIDDLFDLHPRLKLMLQIVSVLPIVFFGYYVDRIVAFGYPIELGWLGIPLTVLWLVGCINALNLIDGMDGLASIIGLSTAVMLGVIAASEGHAHVAMIAVVLASSLAGFLVYNLPPASIFLGDSGSMVIGLTLGVLGIQGAMKTSATLAITAPAVVMTLPLFDIVAAVVRRKLTGRRFDAPDRLHIHHRLLDRGWTPWQVLCMLGAICLTMGAAATAATIFRRDALAWIAAMTLVVLMIRLRLFGYDEFALVKGTVRRTLLGALDSLRDRWRTAWLGNDDSAVAGETSDVPRAAPLVILGSVRNTVGLDDLSCGEAWDRMIRDLRRWKVRQVELLFVRDRQPHRIRWLDPNATDELCVWSLAVSLPGDEADVCELCVAGSEAAGTESSLSALTSLLKTFGKFFAARTEQVFGPPIEVEEVVSAVTRKAA